MKKSFIHAHRIYGKIPHIVETLEQLFSIYHEDNLDMALNLEIIVPVEKHRKIKKKSAKNGVFLKKTPYFKIRGDSDGRNS